MNPGYSPEYNGIEAVFSSVKAFYKKTKLNLLMNDKELNMKVIIRRAFNQLSKPLLPTFKFINFDLNYVYSNK